MLFCTILKRQPLAVSKYLLQNALALSHLRNIPVNVSKYAFWKRTDKLETCSTITPTTENTEHSMHLTFNALGFRSLNANVYIGTCLRFSVLFSHCFATKVTATIIATRFIPSSPLHLLTVSAIPPCFWATFPKFGDLISHRWLVFNLPCNTHPYLWPFVAGSPHIRVNLKQN